MKKFVCCCCLAASLLSSAITLAQQKDYPISPVPFTQVRLTDAFWSPRIERNRTVTIPASFSRCETTGRVSNFVMAAKRQGKFCTKFPFDDTDIYKTIEGASYSLAVHPDTALAAYVDALIDTIGRAQESDGYLYTARTIDSLHPHPWSGPDRWVKEHELSHELYNSGHMFEAAAAHYLATGKRNFLDIALRNADLLVRTFGPGKREVAPGHEIVEMGLVRLYRLTGKKEYLDLAKFFIDARGKRSYDRSNPDEWKNGEYWQDDKPVTQQDVAEGHAVRAMYLYSGMADVAALTGDKQYIDAIDRIWDDMAGKKIYVQGGIGAVPDGERFGDDYYLPNATAYNETCAAIGDVFWNERMFLLHGDAKYIDLLEKVLYNGMLSGVGLDGKSFFYTNAMQVRDDFSHNALERERSGWFECSCCPTNVLRLLPSIPGYVYAAKGEDLYINLFISSTADLTIGGRTLQIVQQNNYPWDGRLSFTLKPASPQNFNLRIRLPGWARGQAIPTNLYSFQDASVTAPVEIRVNGKPGRYTMESGYAILSRQWRPGDEITLNLPMPVRKVVAIPQVIDDHDQMAIQRGPLMYCAEWKDNADKPGKMRLMGDDHFIPENRPELLGGVTVLKGTGAMIDDKVIQEGSRILYREIPVTLIPYYAWANRGKGEMTVWFPER
ncbi:MAG: glycoside hydrolase family 127 protein [Bacteroidota bacterium]|nr:glycoside hydrolase family 127 protein [Bacteroidota bacterium]MDP4215052.1 glycoside hydrolase family 127 protein [Bacteroidota bacterium]MDP4244283.1 glycoside hydrolase family 127 protein [Bacteroidota bacterium]MDP4252787.1 glycoside hydrolase family 127 protein [Bacteroidota bacterium]MDP4257528.1 glycoside hydrolase family 127 protein [Bacteroidota bacterium]